MNEKNHRIIVIVCLAVLAVAIAGGGAAVGCGVSSGRVERLVQERVDADRQYREREYAYERRIADLETSLYEYRAVYGGAVESLSGAISRQGGSIASLRSVFSEIEQIVTGMANYRDNRNIDDGDSDGGSGADSGA
jgi:hypothetical protein